MKLHAGLCAFALLGACTPSVEVASSIPTPPPEAASVASAEYVVEPDRVELGETPKAILTNTGQTTLGYGNAYRLERWVAGRWGRVSEPKDPEVYCAFTEELLLMPPGETKSQSITVCDSHGNDRPLRVGLYRITKRLTDESSPSIDEWVTARARFRIVRAHN
jgi:hypothetical protein